MKVKMQKWVLALEAAACVVFVLLQQSAAHYFSAALAFPFEQLGLALRALSLSGTAGNVLAIALYVLLCILPIALLGWRYIRGNARAEDGLLVVLSAVMFAALYLFINPALMGVYADQLGKGMLGGLIYSVLTAYVVLRLLRLIRGGERHTLHHMMQGFLLVLCMVLIGAAFGGAFQGLLTQIYDLQAANTDHQALLPSYICLVLEYGLSLLSCLLDVWVIFALMMLLRHLQQDDREAAVQAADVLCRRCARSLGLVVVTGVGFNLLQLLLIHHLRTVNGTLLLPLESMILLLGALLLARLVRDMKRIRDENESFI